MKALYWQPPDPQELAALGLMPEDFPPPECALWPDNWPAIKLFSQVSTQWRIGPNGPVGLDYNVVFHEIDRAGMAGEGYDEMMASIRIIEMAALKEIRR